MILDIKDKRVRIFKLVIDGIAIIALLAVIFEMSLSLYCPQLMRSVDSKGNLITDIHVFEKGFIPEGVGLVIEAAEYKVAYYFNNDGFRGKGVSVKPNIKDLTRFLFLGDSFTLGGGNEFSDVFTEIFEELLVKAGYNVDVVNAGTLSGDTLIDVVKLKIYPEKYNFGVAVLVIPTNDILDNKEFSIPKAIAIRKRLKHIVIPNVQEKGMHSIVFLKRLLILNDLFLSKWNLSRGWEKIYLKDGEFRKKQIQITKDLLSRAKTYADSKNIKLIVLLLPDVTQVISKANNFSFKGIDWDSNDEELKDFAKSQNIFMFSVSDEMVARYKENRKDLFFRHDGHLTSEGNRVVAKYLFDKIEKLLK